MVSALVRGGEWHFTGIQLRRPRLGGETRGRPRTHYTNHMQQRKVGGPRLHIPDDDDDDDDDDDSEEVDSDVERLAAQSIDRRRQTTVGKAVADAQAKVREEAAFDLKAAEEEHEATVAELKQEAEMMEATIQELRSELVEAKAEAPRARMQQEREREALDLRFQTLKEDSAQMEGRLEELKRRKGTLDDRLIASETERSELERGILRARDIVAAKDEQLRAMTERAERAEHAYGDQRVQAEGEREAVFQEADGRIVALQAEAREQVAQMEQRAAAAREETMVVREALEQAQAVSHIARTPCAEHGGHSLL